MIKENSINHSKKMAKNTLMLYVRMMLTMFISLFSVRVLLHEMGSVDYGVYNVVGGIVIFFSFISGIMAQASQRYLSFGLGKKSEIGQMQHVFSMIINVYLLIGIIIILISETGGLWLVTNQLSLPGVEKVSIQFIYQFSLLSFLISLIQIPFFSLIIAHENMSIIAKISIVDSLLKLAIIFLLSKIDIDNLILYPILLFSVNILVCAIYIFVSKIKYKECLYKFSWDLKLFKELAHYFSWNLFGSGASALKSHGSNILINIFFGPLVNSARAIAFQVNVAVNSFFQNFSLAVKPQIIKSYASDNLERMNILIFATSKYSFFLSLIISIPIIIESDFIFSLWLTDVPDYTIVFSRLLLIDTLINSFGNSLITGVQATGKIKKYQLIVGTILLINFPATFILFKLGFTPIWTFIASIIISVFLLIARISIVGGLLNFKIILYIKEVLIVSLTVALCSCVAPILFVYYVEEGLFRFILSCLISTISIIFVIFLIGMNKREKALIVNYITKKILNRKESK